MSFTNPQNPFVESGNAGEELGFPVTRPEGESAASIPRAPSIQVAQLNPLLDETPDEEEENYKKHLQEAPPVPVSSSSIGDPILAMLEQRYRELKEKYPGGGWKSMQLVNLDILMKMPKDWLKRYDRYVQAGAEFTRKQLVTLDRSEEVAKAADNPTEDKYQDAAYRAVQSIFTQFLDRNQIRGFDRYLTLNLVASEIIGLSSIDPIWRDRRVDEIIINGPKDIQVEIGGQLQRIPAAQFRDADHVIQLLERIFRSVNKQLSPKTPLLKGRLHDQSRIFAVHPFVAPEGPNVAIRRHPEKYWTAEELIRMGSIDEEVATFLGNLIYKGCSFVVIGGTSTGKTSFLNAMTGFFRPDVRLITLEDNLEMRPHPGKMLAAAMEVKPGSTDRGDKGVTMRDLVHATLQMRPDGLIIGEVTDGAAYDLAQALNTGHFGASTIHANSEYDGVYRIASLIQQGADLSQAQALPLIAAAFDFVILLEHFPEDGSRRMTSISEVDPYPGVGPAGEPTLGVRQLFKFEADGKRKELDRHGVEQDKIYGHWEQVGQLSDVRRKRRHLDLIKDLTWEELKAIAAIPEKAVNH